MLTALNAYSNNTEVTSWLCPEASTPTSECTLFDGEIGEPQINFYKKSFSEKVFRMFSKSAFESSGSESSPYFGVLMEAAMNQGYDEIRGTLSGPRGTISFHYNWRTDAWSISNVPAIRPKEGGAKDPIVGGPE